MKILHVTPYYWPAIRYGGPIFSISGLCKALAVRGHEVHVYTTAIDGSADLDVPVNTPNVVDNVTVSYFKCPILRRLFWAPSMRRALLKNIHEFDLVHIHTVYVWPVFTAAKIAGNAQVPFILAPRGMLEQELMRRKSRFVKNIWLKFFGKKIISSAKALHITTPREEHELRQFHLNMPRTLHIPNGLDLDSLPQTLPTKATPRRNTEQNYVIFLGRISWEKGLDRLVKAWGCGIDCQLTLAGNDETGYSEKLKLLSRKLGIASQLNLIGPVKSDAKWHLLKRAKILVLPSYSENFGNVVLEAMAVGCPVIVTPEVGLAYAVKQYGAGAVVPGEPELLAAKIRELLDDEVQLQEMGRKGQLAAREYFSWSVIAEQMEQEYMEIVRNG